MSPGSHAACVYAPLPLSEFWSWWRKLGPVIRFRVHNHAFNDVAVRLKKKNKKKKGRSGERISQFWPTAMCNWGIFRIAYVNSDSASALSMPSAWYHVAFMSLIGTMVSCALSKLIVELGLNRIGVLQRWQPIYKYIKELHVGSLSKTSCPSVCMFNLLTTFIIFFKSCLYSSVFQFYRLSRAYSLSGFTCSVGIHEWLQASA